MTTQTRPVVTGGIGESVRRPDGEPKVTGNFAYASDLTAPDMLWGATYRSPHTHARLISLDVSAARAMDGVRAVMTQDDVPGNPLFGQEEQDQPVMCDGIARYWGEPVAVVAAEDEETARLAAEAIVAEWEVLTPLVDPEQAVAAGSVLSRTRPHAGQSPFSSGRCPQIHTSSNSHHWGASGH